MQYRPEIDGLRAFAVVPVVLFHAGWSAIGGGFVGVDVFFVISGYLITTILLGDLRAGRFSIVEFYERRARRILPALFTVMALCLPLAWFSLLPDDFRQFARSLAAVPLFSSNVLFWRESGYFAADAEGKPLLHTWSLAVEEQFYLVFPLLLALCWRWGGKRLGLLLGVVVLGSLALSHWGLTHKPEATFFLLPSRAWELAAGALAAIHRLDHPHHRGPSRRGSRRRSLGAALGLALIVGPALIYDHQTPFPGLYAVPPVLGTCLIILCAGPDNAVGRLLALRPLVGIGLVSYSAYLWHQPLFAFARQRSLDEPGPAVFAALCLLTFGLAWLSWRWIERPFRQRRQGRPRFERRAVFGFAATGSLAFVALGVVLASTDWQARSLPAAELRMLGYLGYNKTDDFRSSYRFGSCFIGSEHGSASRFDREDCLDTSPGRRNYLLIGDSHGAHMAHGLARVFPEIHWLQATSSGCRPLIGAKGEARCTDLVRMVYEDFLPRHRIDGVILSARWQPDEIEQLLATTRRLAPLVGEVIVVGPTMEYRTALPELISRLRLTGETDPHAIDAYEMPEKFAISSLLASRLAGQPVHYVPLLNTLCPRGDCRLLTDTGEPMAWDKGHFTASGSEWLVRRLRQSGQLRLG